MTSDQLPAEIPPQRLTGPGDKLMIVGNSLFAAAFACAAFCMTAADAQLGRPTESRPATANDLVGKKICWDNGNIVTLAANGQLTNNRGLHTTWSVPEPGLIQFGADHPRYGHWQILPDGGIYSHSFCGSCGSITGHHEHWGTVCN